MKKTMEKTMEKTPTPAKIKVTRAEIRKRKIILVLEPDLLSNEVFAVNPFYDEGEEKNKLQYIDALIKLREENGELTVTACEYTGCFYTTGHTQIHNVNNLFLNKKDKAINEILRTPYEYIEDEGRMNKLLENWNEDMDFKNYLIKLINSRKEDNSKERISKALENYDKARKELEEAMDLPSIK
jgi:hypothetical protein